MLEVSGNHMRIWGKLSDPAPKETTSIFGADVKLVFDRKDKYNCFSVSVPMGSKVTDRVHGPLRVRRLCRWAG